MNEGYKRYKQSNERKIVLFQEKIRLRYLNVKQSCIELYEKEMNKLVVRNILDKEGHKRHLQTCIEFFNAVKVDGGDTECFNQIRKELEDSIKCQYKSYEQIQEVNQQKNRSVKEAAFIKKLNESRDLYYTNMEKLFTDKKYMEDEELKNAHAINKQIAFSMVNIKSYILNKF